MPVLTRSRSNMSDDKQNEATKAESNVPNVPEWVESLIKKLSEDVKDLKHSVADLVNENIELRTNVEVLQKRLQITEGLTLRNQSKILQQTDQITDLKCRSMRDNVVINGIPEGTNETWEQSKEKFKTFLKDDLKIQDTNDVMIDRVHRTGQKNGRKPRPLIAKLINTTSKDTIFKNVKNLKNKKEISVQEQLPPEVSECRKRLWAKYKEAKTNSANKVSWATDRLIINGVSYSSKDENIEINPAESSRKNIDLHHTAHVVVEDSTFMGHAVRISSKEDVSDVLAELLKDKAVAGATHNVYAYRVQDANGQIFERSKDDGEHGAGYQILKMLREREETNVMIVVTRWFGTKHLGPRRFQCIKESAENALQKLIR